MSFRLCISSDYNAIQIALCSSEIVLDTHRIDKKFGNQRLLIDIDMLLNRHALRLNDIAFIYINLGPAPYTSLRIAIATANGLHDATGIPLIGIDALKAFVHAYAPRDANHATVALLNAFNNELFYAVSRHDQPTQTGYEKADVLLERLNSELEGLTVSMIGNGAPGSNDLDYPTIEQLTQYAWQTSKQNETIDTALPLYLKQITL